MTHKARDLLFIENDLSLPNTVQMFCLLIDASLTGVGVASFQGNGDNLGKWNTQNKNFVSTSRLITAEEQDVFTNRREITTPDVTLRV